MTYTRPCSLAGRTIPWPFVPTGNCDIFAGICQQQWVPADHQLTLPDLTQHIRTVHGGNQYDKGHLKERPCRRRWIQWCPVELSAAVRYHAAMVAIAS